MSSSSDSEDENLKLILEAADTNLLTDSLFNSKKYKEALPPVEVPKSQRLLQDNDDTCIDFVPPESVQKLMTKKLALLIQEQVEFIPDADTNLANRMHKRKSRVRLLNGFECYVKPYEDFEYEDVGPRKKPRIKRRSVENDVIDEETKLMLAAVDGKSILSGKETENWSKRSKGKVFCYKLGGGPSKQQHLIEDENEFTKLRRKNKWNESKIKTTKFSIK